MSETNIQSRKSQLSKHSTGPLLFVIIFKTSIELFMTQKELFMTQKVTTLLLLKMALYALDNDSKLKSDMS